MVVSSVNCRGLSIKHPQKLTNAHDYINNTNSHITCLQETHWTNSDIRELIFFTNNDIIINGEYTNKRGVAILLKNKFQYKIFKTLRDHESRALTIEILIENYFSFRLINIYKPNHDNPDFDSYVQKLHESSDCTYTIITGEFNLPLIH